MRERFTLASSSPRAGLLRDEQIELIRQVVAKLAEHGAMVNELLHVDEDGAMRFEVVPPA